MTCRTVSLALAGVALPIAIGAQQTPTFRVSADSVSIDVSVTIGRQPVSGLTLDDFELLDNGVRQTLLHADRSMLPLDVTLVADLSSSMVDGWTGGLIFARHDDAGPWLRAGLNGIVEMLGPQDRLRLLEVGSAARMAAGTHLPSGALGQDPKARRSSLFDAIALALVQRAEPERRRLIVVLTDGHDTSSLSDVDTRSKILGRSDAVVHIVAIGIRGAATLVDPRDAPPTPLQGVRVRESAVDWNGLIGNYDWVYKDMADRTGGRFWLTNEADDFLPQLREIIGDFRSRYVLRYVPSGVARGGWHDVEVRLVGRRRGTVEARRGYFFGG